MSFDRAIKFVLKWEGGYSNNPADPGGETKFGISKKAYPAVDIKELTEEQARAIYRRDYWDKAGCELLDWPMCLVVFDCAVNLGVKRAVEFRDKALNWSDCLFMRLEFYSALNKPVFLRGWLNRVLDLWRTVKGE